MKPGEIQNLDDLKSEYDDDPVVIAVKAFRADDSCRRLWRRYLIAMQILEKSVSKANDDFLELIYTIQSEIKHDIIPPMHETKNGYIIKNYHSFLFHNRLKKIFLARYGYVDFNRLMPRNIPTAFIASKKRITQSDR